MSLTNLQYLGTVLLSGVAHSFGTTELQGFLDMEGDPQLAFARALETEAAKTMFRFSAGDESVDKSVYANNLIKLAHQVREDYSEYGPSDVSQVTSWSDSAYFGTADTDYNKPVW